MERPRFGWLALPLAGGATLRELVGTVTDATADVPPALPFSATLAASLAALAFRTAPLAVGFGADTAAAPATGSTADIFPGRLGFFAGATARATVEAAGVGLVLTLVVFGFTGFAGFSAGSVCFFLLAIVTVENAYRF
jgi:hypothetical protein